MPETKTGFHLERVNGQNYTINIPHRASQGERVPLIVLLHWAGRKFRWFGRGILEDLGLPAFSMMQAIIVAPDRRRRHWAKPKAAEDLAKLVSYLGHHHNLDPQKRAVAGYSLGGIGVWYLMVERPDLFPCGVAMAAPVPNEIIKPDLKRPLYTILSDLDERIPYTPNRERAEKLIDEGAPLEFHTVQDAPHSEVRSYIPALTRSISWMEKIWSQ